MKNLLIPIFILLSLIVQSQTTVTVKKDTTTSTVIRPGIDTTITTTENTDSTIKILSKRPLSVVVKPVVTQPPVGGNIALKKPVTASSLETNAFPASLAVDGIATTRWSSKFADPQSIQVDLGGSVPIRRVKINWEFAAGKNYRIETSENGTTWIVLKTITNNTALVNDHTGLSGQGRYLRIYGTARSTIYGYSIFELEVYSDGTIPPPTNQLPQASAGADQNITLPTNSVSLAGSGTDADGTISSYNWAIVSGSGTITNANSATTTITGLPQGTHSYRLTVTDNKGGTGTDVVQVTVNTTPPTGTIKYLELPLASNQSYSNQSNIIIEGKRFTNPGGNILNFNNCTNVTIRNCYFGASSGEAIAITGGNNFTIEKNLFANNRTMVYCVNTTGNIKVINNQFVNAKGPFPRGQYTQFNACSGAGNLVQGNVGECFEGNSHPEDLISTFESKGTQASPLTIRDNVYRGGGPSTSGGGIMAGDYGGEWVLVENNKLVNVGQYSIAASGGHNIVIRNNQVYADQKAWNNIGYYVADYTNGAGCGNITLSGNRSHYINKSGSRNDFWSSGECSCSCASPTDITLSEMNIPAHLITFITPAELAIISKQ